MAVKELIITIKAEAGDLIAGLKLVGEQSKDLETKLAGAATVSAAAFAALSAVVGVSVARFAEFESAFTNVVTLLDDSSFKTKTLEQGIDDLKKGVLNLGAATGQSFATLNAGLFTIISAGVPAEQAIQALKAATDLAAAGATTTAIAVDGLTSAMGAYKLGADQAQNIAEKFFTAQKSGKTTVEQLASGFGLVAGQASAMGVKLDELLAAVSAVTLGGVQTTSAYSGLRQVLVNIAKPTADAAAEALRLGVNFDATALRTQGLTKFLNNITGSANYTKESLVTLFGSAEAVNFVLQLAGGSADAYKDILKKVGDQAVLDADYQRALAAAHATVQFSLDKLKVSADAALITLGEKFAPTVIKVADALSSAVNWFRGLDDTTLTVIATILKVAAALAATVFSFTSVAFAIAKAITIGKDIIIVFETLSVAASATAVGFASFTAVATGGLTLILAFLPEILGELKEVMPWWKDFFGIGSTPEAHATQDALVSNRRAIQDQQSAIRDYTDLWRNSQGSMKNYYLNLIGQSNDAIKQLEKERATMLQHGPGGAKSAGGSAGPTADPAEQAKTEAKRLEVQKRIILADQENSILFAKQQGASDDELELMKETYALEAAAREANMTVDADLRQKLLDNIELQHQAISDKQQALDEKLLGFQQEMADATEEARDELSQKDMQALESSYQTKTQLESAYQRKLIETRRAADAQFLADQKKNGTLYATMNEVINSQEVQGYAKTANDLAQLQNSKNSTMQAVGKAAALTQLTYNTASAAMGAFNSLSAIPYVGYILGLAAAASVVAYGAEQASVIMGANSGALVGGVGNQDSVRAMLTPGELVIPAAQTQQFLPVLAREQAKMDGKATPNEGGGNVGVSIGFQDDAARYLTAKQQQQQKQGVYS